MSKDDDDDDDDDYAKTTMNKRMISPHQPMSRSVVAKRIEPSEAGLPRKASELFRVPASGIHGDVE